MFYTWRCEIAQATEILYLANPSPQQGKESTEQQGAASIQRGIGGNEAELQGELQAGRKVMEMYLFEMLLVKSTPTSHKQDTYKEPPKHHSSLPRVTDDKVNIV